MNSTAENTRVNNLLVQIGLTIRARRLAMFPKVQHYCVDVSHIH